MPAVIFKGEYNDGVSASAHAVDVAFADGSFIIQDDRFPKSAPVHALKISARLGRLPRTLTLPDGSQVVVPDSIMLSQQLQEGTSYLRKLEANFAVAVAWVYWYARALKADGQDAKARENYELISDQFNFYGQLAREELIGAKRWLPLPAPPRPSAMR